MIGNMKFGRILWSISGLLAIVAALIGVMNPTIYSLVITSELLPGVIAQDVVTIIASVILLLLAVRIDETDTTKQMLILGIMGYLFYGYGLYVIERLYNIIYLLYMAIFSLSVYTILYNAANIKRSSLDTITIPRSIKNASAVYLVVNAIVFNLLWISQLLPLMQSGQKIEFLYGVYILDLCFVMPLFMIASISALRNRGPGLLVTPVLLVFGFLVLIPLALTELSKPLFYGLPMELEGMALFLTLSMLFLMLAFLYLRKMEFGQDRK